jgi:hypothetical protein
MTREQVIAEALKELEVPEKRALPEQEVQDHVAIRDGDTVAVALVRAKQEARRAAWMAEFASVTSVIRNPMACVARPEAPWSDNTLRELADKARALITQNDPDAIRAGLADIANALDSMTQ